MKASGMHDVCDRWPNAALKMAAAATASSPQAWEDEPVELQPGLPAELEAELELMLNTPPGSPIPVDIGCREKHTQDLIA